MREPIAEFGSAAYPGHMHERVSNGEALTRIFGCWPSFHDAEILRVRHDRGEGDDDAPSLEADFHVWVLPNGDAGAGDELIRQHGSLVTLRFDGVDELDLHGFNGQNVLSALEIEDLSQLDQPETRWGVTLPSLYGMGGSFVCAAITVASARPVVLP